MASSPRLRLCLPHQVPCMSGGPGGQPGDPGVSCKGPGSRAAPGTGVQGSWPRRPQGSAGAHGPLQSHLPAFASCILVAASFVFCCLFAPLPSQVVPSSLCALPHSLFNVSRPPHLPTLHRNQRHGAPGEGRCNPATASGNSCRRGLASTPPPPLPLVLKLPSP